MAPSRDLPGGWGMTSPEYSELPQELLLDVELRRPVEKPRPSEPPLTLGHPMKSRTQLWCGHPWGDTAQSHHCLPQL